MTFPTKTNNNSWYHSICQSSTTSCASYVALGIFAAACGWYGYKKFDASREATAQQAFYNAQELYSKTMQSEKPDFTSLESVLNEAYTTYQNRSVAPYLLNLQADVAMAQHQSDQALAYMQQARTALSAYSPLYSFYNVKYALMLIDTNQAERIEQGLKMLEQVAQNKQSHNWDQAAYYRGLYFRLHGDMPKAIEAWSDLLSMPTDIPNGTSPWALIAQTTLQK